MILQSVQNGQNHVQIVFKQAPWLRHWTLFLKYICDQIGHLHVLTVNRPTSQNIQKHQHFKFTIDYNYTTNYDYTVRLSITIDYNYCLTS